MTIGTLVTFATRAASHIPWAALVQAGLPLAASRWSHQKEAGRGGAGPDDQRSSLRLGEFSWRVHELECRLLESERLRQEQGRQLAELRREHEQSAARLRAGIWRLRATLALALAALALAVTALAVLSSG